MALIDDQIAALRDAIAAGVLKVVTRSGEDEREVTYGSFRDMKERLNWLQREKAKAEGRDIRVTVASFDRARGGPVSDWDKN